MSKFITLVFVVTFSLHVLVSASQNKSLTQECLGCICEATSACNTTVGCIGEICGPFHITWAYWSDAGKLTVHGLPNTDPNAYSTCANDVQCAAHTVHGYMEKYAQDCNNDGIVDCDDYVRIHYLGGFGCTGTLQSKYESAYLNCRAHFH